GVGQGRPDRRRHRPVGDQRGVRLGCPAVHEGHGHRPGRRERQRWSHGHGSPARRHRRHHPRHARRRAAPPGQAVRPRDLVCRRRYGHRHDRRSPLSTDFRRDRDMTEQTAVRYDIDADGIVTLTLDDPNQSANTMNALYQSSMKAAVERLYAEADQVTGVVVTSAKKTFFAGGDLKLLLQARRENATDVFTEVENLKAVLRKLETFPKPVVAAINGAALGGGLEIALATNYRIAVDGKYGIGLPEVKLGLLPGGGGLTRLTRMFGIMAAMTGYVATGNEFKPAVAQAKGIVNELVATQEELIPAAKAWIKANPEAISQPRDQPGYKIPGGTPSSPALAGFLPAFAPMLKKQIKQANYNAPKAILAAVVEGTQVDFDTASRIESRYFTTLVTSQQSKNMIQAFFFDLGSINAGKERPAGVEKYTPSKVIVLGAGMMGAGIAYVLARAGVEVVLKDVSIEAAEKGKAYTAGIN